MASRKLNRRRNKRNTRQKKGKKQTSKLIKCKRCNKSKRISRKNFKKLRNAGMNMNDIYTYFCCGVDQDARSSDDNSVKRSEGKNIAVPVPYIYEGPINKLSPKTVQAYQERLRAKEALLNKSNMSTGANNGILAYRRRALTRSLVEINREKEARAKAREEAEAKAEAEAEAKAEAEERATAIQLEKERATPRQLEEASKPKNKTRKGIFRFKRLG